MARHRPTIFAPPLCTTISCPSLIWAALVRSFRHSLVDPSRERVTAPLDTPDEMTAARIQLFYVRRRPVVN